MDIATLQREVNKRWSDQKGNPCHLSSPSHALMHSMKALGAIASAMNDAEHEGRTVRADEVQKYLADLVICAARLAASTVDLDAACEERLQAKFPVTTTPAADAQTSGERESHAQIRLTPLSPGNHVRVVSGNGTGVEGTVNFIDWNGRRVLVQRWGGRQTGLEWYLVENCIFSGHLSGKHVISVRNDINYPHAPAAAK
jgi:hypothetical protein